MVRLNEGRDDRKGNGTISAAQARLAKAGYYTGPKQDRVVYELFPETSGTKTDKPVFASCQKCLEAARSAKNGSVPRKCIKAILKTTHCGLPKEAVLNPEFQKVLRIHLEEGTPIHELVVPHQLFCAEPTEVHWVRPSEVSCATNCLALARWFPHLQKLITGEPPASAHSNVGSLPIDEKDSYSYIGQNGWGDRC